MGIVNAKLVSSMLNYDIKKGKHQSYMTTDIVTILYLYKGILFTINCDIFQQFKVYDENTETCYLLDASTLCNLDNNDNLKLIVKENIDHIYMEIYHMLQ